MSFSLSLSLRSCCSCPGLWFPRAGPPLCSVPSSRLSVLAELLREPGLVSGLRGGELAEVMLF